MGCPICTNQLDLGWWLDHMDRVSKDGFRDLVVVCQRCGDTGSLADLVYEWPQGFARWCADVMNPNVGVLDDDQVSELSERLQHRVDIVYQHI